MSVAPRECLWFCITTFAQSGCGSDVALEGSGDRVADVRSRAFPSFLLLKKVFMYPLRL